MVKKYLQNPKKTPLEPLALLATVGQACVCVFVFVSVCVCCEERRCGVVTLKSPKKNTYLSILKQTLYLTKTQQN